MPQFSSIILPRMFRRALKYTASEATLTVYSQLLCYRVATLPLVCRLLGLCDLYCAPVHVKATSDTPLPIAFFRDCFRIFGSVHYSSLPSLFCWQQAVQT